MKLRIKFTLGINRRGVWLREEEIKGLELLYKVGYLPLQTFYNYVSAVGDYKITYNSFRNRVREKYVEWKLVRRFEYSLGQDGFNYLYLSIGINGVRLLKEQNFISENATAVPHRKVNSRHVDHTLAARNVIADTLIEETKNSVPEITHGSQLKQHPNQQISLRPDWILENGQNQLYLELDSGKQTHSIIRDKLRRYFQYASLFPEQQHTVLFSVLDDSFHSRFSYGERSRRIMSLKESISKLQIPENLDVCVVSYYRAPMVAYHLLSRISDPTQESALHSNLEQALTLLSNKANYSLSTIDTSDSYTDVAFTLEKEGAEALTTLCMFINEGSVKDYLRVKQAQAAHRNNSNKRILCFYTLRESSAHDLLPILDEVANIAFIDLLTLMYGREEVSYPPILKDFGGSFLDWIIGYSECDGV